MSFKIKALLNCLLDRACLDLVHCGCDHFYFGFAKLYKDASEGWENIWLADK